MEQIVRVPRRTLSMCALLFLAACGGDGNTDDAAAAAAAQSTTAVDSGTATTPTVAGAQSGAVDQQLAARGQQLFTEKICNTCHSIGAGRLVGPDLQGVTDRRSRDWILSMIMHPDSMIQADSIARRLFGEYMTPMVNQNLSRDDASALYEFLRSGGSPN